MNKTRLYRRRYVPEETVFLKDDEIVLHNEDVMVTKWRVLRPKEKFDHGVSCYFLKEGYKISKFLNKNNDIVYFYCDIIDTIYDEKEDSYVFCDLLADVIVHKDGAVEVVDVGEMADALEEGLLSEELLKKGLRRLDKLLRIIYDNGLSRLCSYLEIEG